MADFDKGGSSGGAGSALRRRADSADDDSSLGVGHSKPGHPRPSPAARRSYMRNWVGFFLLGTINNLTYVIVGSAAKTISDSFGKGNLIGMIPWALVGFSFVARVMNTFVVHNTSYSGRMLFNAVLMAAGLVGVAFAPNFWLAIVAIIVSGSASSFGESVMLGYLRLYDADLVNAWSSGTGLAGVGGSALYLLYKSSGLTLRASFLVTIPWVALYLGAFFLLLDRAGAEFKREPPTVDAEETPLLGVVQANDSTSAPDDDAESGGAGSGPAETGLQRQWRCIKLISFLANQLLWVYFFEYVISSGCAGKVLTPLEDCDFSHRPQCEVEPRCEWSPGDNVCQSTKFLYRNTYEILAFCYQFGVLISRSSLAYIKITRVDIITILQGANMILWLNQDLFKFINIWALFPLMVFVGLLGGASYVNTFYLLLRDPKIPVADRELSVNLAAFAITLGITLASVFIIFMDQTFLKDK